jgi:hypothetical protein
MQKQGELYIYIYIYSSVWLLLRLEKQKMEAERTYIPVLFNLKIYSFNKR